MNIKGSVSAVDVNVFYLASIYKDKGYLVDVDHDKLTVNLKGRKFIFYAGVLSFFRPDGGWESLRIYKLEDELKFILSIDHKVPIAFSGLATIVLLLARVVIVGLDFELNYFIGLIFVFVAIILIQAVLGGLFFAVTKFNLKRYSLKSV